MDDADVLFLRPVWLYLPDGSKERIIAQIGDDKGIGFDSVHAGVETRRYFRYNNYSITQTEKGDYVISPVDDRCEKIYYPNGMYEYVSKVVVHDGFWEARVRRNSSSEWRVACWSLRRVSMEKRCDGWYWRRIGKYRWTDPGYELKFADGSVCFHASDNYDAPVRKVYRYFTGEWHIWCEDENGGEEFFSFDEQHYELIFCDDILYATEKNSERVENKASTDQVNHPSHYASLDPEPITFIRDRDYLTGSALKYIFRSAISYNRLGDYIPEEK